VSDCTRWSEGDTWGRRRASRRHHHLSHNHHQLNLLEERPCPAHARPGDALHAAKQNHTDQQLCTQKHHGKPIHSTHAVAQHPNPSPTSDQNHVCM